MNRYQWTILRENFVKGKYSFLGCLLGMGLIFGVAFVVPHQWEILVIPTEELGGLSATMLGSFIGVSGIALAISAIILSILQIANRRINITELIFRNSFFAPTFYFGLINACLLAFLGLFLPKGQTMMTEFVLARFVVVETYCFIVFCLLISIVFFNVFKYLNFTNIIKEYNWEVVFLVEAEKKVKMDGRQAQKLSIKGKEIYEEIRAGIEKEDRIIVDTFLTTLSEAFEINSNSNLLAGITTELREWFLLSEKVNDYTLQARLLVFWRRTMNFLSENPENSTRIYFAYQSSYIYLQCKKQRPETLIGQAFAIRLKEMIQYKTDGLDDKSPEEINRSMNAIQYLFIDFNSLIKIFSENSDLQNLRYAINQLKLLRTYNFFRNKEVYDDEHAAKAFNDSVVVDTEKQKMIKERFFHQLNTIPFGIYVFFIFRKFYHSSTDPLHQEVLTALLEGVYLQNDDDIFKLLLQYATASNSEYDYNGWIWNLEVRMDGEVYSLPTLADFFGTGFVYLLMSGQLEVESPSEKVLSHSQFPALLHAAQDALTVFEQQAEIWMPSLKIATTELYADRIAHVRTLLQGFHQSKESIQHRNIANTPLSERKIAAFTELMADQWRKADNLFRIFSHFNTVTINPTQELKRVGRLVRVKNLKELFIEGSNIHVGDLNFGKQVIRDKEFLLGAILNRLVSTTTIKQHEIVDGIVQAVAKLEKNGTTPHIIISTYPAFSRMQMDLIKSGNYLPNSAVGTSVYPFDYMGIFNNKLPVVNVRMPNFNDKIIVASLGKGIGLLQRQKEEWIDKRLSVQVRCIDQAEAEKQYRENGNEYKDISYEDALHDIMSGVLIDIEEICDFQVLDPTAVEVFETK